MFRSLPTLSIAVPAPTAAGPLRAPPTRGGGPNRDWRGSRSLRLGVILATCGAVALLGWILATDASDSGPGDVALGPVAEGCGPAHCMAGQRHVSPPLPREWRWEGKRVDFERMYRR